MSSEVEKLVEKAEHAAMLYSELAEREGTSSDREAAKDLMDAVVAANAAIAKDAVQIKQCFTCYLDVDEKHPELYGQCILPRDDDGIGFALMLEELHGKHVLITIEETPDPCHPEGFVYRKAQPKEGAK